MKVVNLIDIRYICLNVFGFKSKPKDDISSRSKGTDNLQQPLFL